ncbi:MAG: LLM class F420-dependent oxidoreductase [Dehalococcoidia bacterium]|jgi:alkanesulfonate monooxygenase SsuD/methylene tetrahydromethanopterin reductase-like flavin-dependent oxidoreductase (luciferase family)|nr:MAG: LLM class F420-dependent oxidoreductase [Dehalococcoidia bacterium]
MARVGLSRALARSGREWQELSRAAERAGLAGLWPADLAGSDCFVDAALALAATETAHVGIVVALPTRSAAQTAAAAAALAAYAPGRFLLGLGAGNDYLNPTVHNVPFAPPLARLRDFHAAVTALLRAPAGAPVSYQGPYQQVSALGFGLDEAALPVLLGAHGPAMTRLAAEIADGLAVQVITPLPTLAARAQLVRERRQRGSFPIILGMIASVDDDEATASRRARAEIAAALSLPRFRPRLAEAAGDALAARFSERCDAGDLSGAAALLPEEIVRAFAIVARPDTFAEAAGAIADADIVVPVPPDLFAGRFGARLGFTPADAAAAREMLVSTLLAAA